MSKKSAKIAALIEGCRGKSRDPHYLGYFACFNEELFFEAHDVLEELWLKDKHSPNYSFHKGLIQFAGAFVHLQKDRLKPSAALFNLARANFEKYPPFHEGFDIAGALGLIQHWLALLEAGQYHANPIRSHAPPKLTVAA
ncbi:MAG TPA: DUF309 domain-containing protein [Methylomirabilota bacterium]|nr:DUF309 domain-containing protein [Methylomirabilota bacterium]